MKETFSNRLNYALSFNNMKAVELVEKSGLSKSLISGYLNGKFLARQDKITLLASILNVDEAWLMGYDVPMQPNIINNTFSLSDQPIKVVVLGKISAGLPLLATENIEGYEFAPSSEIKEGHEYFYLKVQGDSMNLKFNEGDIVLVQKQDDLENNEIGVFLIDGMDATVKKYKVENGLIILEPMSTNPQNTVQVYDPKKISVKIIGKVISYQGKI